ncbi:MAG: hypothetical protein O2912_03705 [Proteobacteria bacterium]|nr:hypothetical protein [Pseudomonadota bacterium]
MAGGTPRDHFAGAGRREFVVTGARLAQRVVVVAGTELDNAAAISGPAQNFIGRANTIQYIEAMHDDMRRPPDITPGPEHYVRLSDRRTVPALRWPDVIVDRRFRQLHTGHGANAFDHFLEIKFAFGLALGLIDFRVLHGAPRHHQHETRIDAVFALIDATSCLAAQAGPFFGLMWPAAGFQNFQHARGDRFSIRAIDTNFGGHRHRANFQALAASSTGVNDLINPCI